MPSFWEKDIDRKFARTEAFLAVDGGGTKTEFLFAGKSGKLAGFSLGPSNPNGVGPAQSAAVLKEGILRCLEISPISYCFVGLSGAMTGGAGAEVSNILAQENWAFPVCIESDLVSAVTSVHGSGDGAVLISGTGVAGVIRKKGVLRRMAGWGYLLDGGGSGFDLGADAFRACARAIDGRGPETDLISRIEEQSGKSFAEALRACYAGGPSEFASYASLVFRSAEAGDPVAEMISDRYCGAVAELADDLVKESPEGVPLGLVGGIFREEKMILPIIRKKMKFQAEFSVNPRPQIEGALEEAVCRYAAGRMKK